MTTNSFAHVDYPSQHPGVARGERLGELLMALTRGFDGARASASLLLAALVAAVLAVANEVVHTWTDGHLLAAWIALWAIAFAALALLAAPAARTAAATREALRQWAAARKRRIADDHLWQVALRDARVMAEINRAMTSAAVADIKRYY
jgi:hypothetical protein